MELKKESLLSQWKKRKELEDVRQKITKAPESEHFPISKGQERLWFLQQLYPGNPFYNYAEQYTFKGILRIDYLKKSLQLVLEEHDILKASFSYTEEKATQKINKNLEVPIHFSDISTLSELDKTYKKKEILDCESKTSFNLSTPPLLRITIIKEAVDCHILILVMHHIIIDKWSMGIFRDRLSHHYRTFITQGKSEVAKPEIQYTDYAYWQQKMIIPKEEIGYWRNQLSGDIPTLNLPFDYTKPLHQTFKGAFVSRKFSKELSKNILKTAKKMEVTPYVLLLSAYYVLLYKYSGQKDIFVGTPISNRNQKTLEGVIGFFNDTVVLRNYLSEELSYINLLNQTKEITFAAFENKNVPFDVLVKELKANRSLNDNPFFQTMFLYHVESPLPSFGSELDMSQSLFDIGVSKFDLTLYFAENEEGLSATFEYSTDLFLESTIKRMHDHLFLLLNTIVEDPYRNISKIPMCTAEERKIIFTDSTPQKNPWSNFNSIHDIITDLAVKNINNIAVIADASAITYGQLLEKSGVLAQQILLHTKGKKEIIALALPRTTDLIVGILGILRSGCAYLPIDTEYPEGRIGFMIEDAEIGIIITQKSLCPKFEIFKAELVYVDNLEATLHLNGHVFPEVDLQDIAYMIYTSGSTGKPKGVPISHGNLINSTAGRLDFYNENPESFLLMSSISFDSSKAGLFWTLCTGGTLVLSPKHLEQDLENMADTILKHKVSHTLMLPSLYKLLLENAPIEKLKSLKVVIVAGEVCTSKVVETHFGRLSTTGLYNEYGPTEATVWCIAHKIEPKDIKGKIPIGKPVAGAKILLLDEHLNLVPFGAIGTIYIAGPGLSSGYWNRLDSTAKVFVKNPFNEDSREFMYNTGDLGRYRSDGSILFLGRIDQQVKIRGYRVELSEIENILLKFPKIKDAVVLLENGSKGIINAPILNSEVEKIVEFIATKLSDEQAAELLSSIDGLNAFQKDYLLEQFEQ